MPAVEGLMIKEAGQERYAFHPGTTVSFPPEADVEVRLAGPATSLAALVVVELQTMTASVSPNPPAAGQPFSVTFSAFPDSTPGLTGTGLTRTGTAPASGELVINATKAGFHPLQVTAATTPAVAPAATGGALTLFNGSVFLETPTVTAGYPEPTLELTALTRNGADIKAELVNGDEIPDAVKSTESTYSATWVISNGVLPNVTITKTLVVAAAAITPTVEPVPARLYAGQTAADIPNIATYLNNANYSSGTAQLQVNDENATTSDVLAEGDVVSVLVTGAGNVFRRWTLSTVEYAVKFVSKGAGGWAVDINDLIPGTTNVTLSWDGGTKVTTRNAIEAGPVVNVVPTISLDGETFTVSNPGPWINEYSAGAISFSYQWRRNGANITGASGPNATSYTRVAADAGTTTTVAVTATDSNGSSAPFVTNGIANPAAQTFTDYTRLAGHFVSQSTSTPSAGPVLFPGNDIGAAHPNRKVLLFAGQSGSNGITITGAKAIAGGQTVTMTQVRPGQASTATTPNTYLIAYEAVVPLGTACDFEVTYSGPTQSRMIDYLVGVGTSISAHNSGTTGGTTAAITTALTGATVGHKLIAVHLRATSSTVDWTGITEVYEIPYGTTVRYASGAEGFVPAGGAPSVTATMGGGAQAALILIAAGA